MYLFIWQEKCTVSQSLLQNESLQDNKTAEYSISQRVDLNIEHFPQVYV